MMRATPHRFAFCTGSHTIGSKGQMHQLFVPVPFLYRFVWKRTYAGSVHTSRLSKYLWTLGCYPSGREVPFRLEEFKENYLREHVPLEVEEWLKHIVEDPIEAIGPNLNEFVKALEDVPLPRKRSWKKAECFSLHKVLTPLNKALEPLQIEIPALAVRGVAQNPGLKECVLDTAFELGEVLQESGCTTYRRWSRQLMVDSLEQYEQVPGREEQTLRLSGSDPSASNGDNITIGEEEAAMGVDLANAPKIEEALASVFAVPESTAPDERATARLLTLFAEGAFEMKKYEDADNLLGAAMNFAHDEELQGNIQTNLAAAKISMGHFKEAESFAKEAVLRVQSPRAYANWAVATALQEDHDEALDIASRALELFPESQEVANMYQSLARGIGGRTTSSPEWRGKRAQVPYQNAKGLETRRHTSMLHEWDRKVDQNTGRYRTVQIDGSQREGSHVVLRVGNLGGFQHTTSTIGHM